ncbi:hypothetical protein Q5P01_000495 [Channa striata]|uniref:Ig-like domain-containing protein n=1 Tax=Channa striata TaxID=64152 RepID=A0AA88IQG8_CHASR|nr:hypothetical protein Q5P01_000495 [Channa striata]
MLVSPSLPVAEGTSVTLGCKFRTDKILSNVFFYQNDKLIQNDTRVELNISAVSKSDEGFYKCEGKHSFSSQYKKSPQSWVSVKLSTAESSSFPVPLIVTLVCGVLTVILLMLLCCYRRLKDSWFIRSQSTNQSSATDHMISQDESQPKKNASLHSDVCLYELIKDPEDPEFDDSRDATYSSIELKNITNDKKKMAPEESSVYFDVKTPADDTLMYAEVHFLNPGKARKNKGKCSPAAAEEAVYSEVKLTQTLDR